MITTRPPSIRGSLFPRGLAWVFATITAFVALGGLPSRASEEPAGVELFNGRDLAGWTTWLVDTRGDDPRRVFTVTQGLLRISGDGLGYLGTTGTFSNFRLTVEWRWGTLNTRWGDRVGKARDSGLFLHATGPDGNSHDGQGAFMAAIECNIFQGAVGDILLIRGNDAEGRLIQPMATVLGDARRDAEGWPTWNPQGTPQPLVRWGRINHRGKAPRWRDQTDFRGPDDVERPAPEWNTLVCEARGDQLRIRLNGIVVNEATGLFPNRGRILLQCEGSEIYFRKVHLQPLDPRGTSTRP